MTRQWHMDGDREHGQNVLINGDAVASGKVLVAGGQPFGVCFLRSAELYDPMSGTWTTTGELATARFSTLRRCYRQARCWWQADAHLSVLSSAEAV